MFKSMLKPGILAGVVGAIVSILVSVLLILAWYLPDRTAAILSCLNLPIELLLGIGIGILAAFFAQRQSPEKLTASKTALAGVIAGLVSTLVGLLSLPITLTMQNTPTLQARMVDIQVETYRMMGMPADQIELGRAQVIAAQKSGATSNVAFIAIGVVIGLVLSLALGAGGGALGALFFKPSLRRKLVCEKCQAAFELGGNAFIEVNEGRPDLVDYCNWDDLMPVKAKEQRAVVAQVLKIRVADRQWQCGMCKTVQVYPTTRT